MLVEWAKVNLMDGLWKGVLTATRDVTNLPANVDHKVDSQVEV